MQKQTIFDVLREDHDEQRQLIEEILETEGDSPERRQLFGRLKRTATDHAAVEERVFYARLMGSETTRDKAGHSVKEHKELDDLFDELADKDMGSSGWLNRFRTLQELLEHHLEEEEQEVFQLAGKELDEQEKLSLADAFLSERAATSAA